MTNIEIIDTLFPMRPDAHEDWRRTTEHERIGATAMAKAKDGIFRHQLERILRAATDPDGCYGDTIAEIRATLAHYTGEEVRS